MARRRDLARDLGLLTRMRIVERMRLLEALPAFESPTQKPPPRKEVK